MNPVFPTEFTPYQTTICCHKRPLKKAALWLKGADAAQYEDTRCLCQPVTLQFTSMSVHTHKRFWRYLINHMTCIVWCYHYFEEYDFSERHAIFTLRLFLQRSTKGPRGLHHMLQWLETNTRKTNELLFDCKASYIHGCCCKEAANSKRWIHAHVQIGSTEDLYVTTGSR